MIIVLLFFMKKKEILNKKINKYGIYKKDERREERK